MSTTVEISPHASDNFVGNDGASNWANAISGANGTRLRGSTGTQRDGEGALYNNVFAWRCRRVIYNFDTSLIPDDAIIESANLYFYGFLTTAGIRFDAYLVQQASVSNTSVVATDYNTFGRTTAGADNPAVITTKNVWTALSIPLNSVGLGWIDKTGYTKLGLMNYYDFNQITPPQENAARSGVNFSEDTVYTPPYLEVTYSAASPAAQTARRGAVMMG